MCIIKSNLIQHAKYETISSNKTKGLKAPSPVSLEHFVYPHRLYKIYFKNQNINTYTKKIIFLNNQNLKKMKILKKIENLNFTENFEIFEFF